MRNHRALFGTVVLAAIAALGACGSSGGGSAATSSSSSATSSSSSSSSSSVASSSSSSSSGGDPCSYATKDEVGAAIGVSISLAKQESATQCGYFPDTPSTTNGFYVEVQDGGAYDAMKRTLVNTEPVSGVGDDAFWAAPALRVKSGSKMIVIQVMDVTWNGGDSKGAAVNVAQKVITRL